LKIYIEVSGTGTHHSAEHLTLPVSQRSYPPWHMRVHMHRRRRGWSSWRSRWRRGRRCVDLHLYTFACSSHGAARRCLTIGSQWVQIPRHGDPIVTVTSMAPTLTSEVLVCDERADCFRASQWAAAGCNQRRTHWALPSLKQPKANRHRNTTKPAH
jgi:hypothetical protein